MSVNRCSSSADSVRFAHERPASDAGRLLEVVEAACPRYRNGCHHEALTKRVPQSLLVGLSHQYALADGSVRQIRSKEYGLAVHPPIG